MRIFLKHPQICIHWDTQREMIHGTRTEIGTIREQEEAHGN